jgi:hypothetical protein
LRLENQAVSFRAEKTRAHVVVIADNQGCRYPPLMYTEAGRRMTAKLWEETLKELRFARVESLLEEIGK